MIICLLCSCSSKNIIEKNDVKNNKYVLLFSDALKEKHLDKKVDSLFEEIINSNDEGKFDSIQKFILINEWYSCNGLFF
jgi:hypothetical protein